MCAYIPRLISSKIEEAHKYFPVIVVTGPRQSGKSTLCRNLYPDYKYFNLEQISNRTRALAEPETLIEDLGDYVIIDEIQYAPDLLSLIQVRVDEDKKLRYVLTGSNNFSLLKSVTQSLAGRAAVFTLLPFSFKEMNEVECTQSVETLMWCGQYPGVLVDEIPPELFFRNYYTTYVERDLRDLINLKSLVAFDKFIRLMALRVGSEFNASAISREVGVTSKTISEWQSLLATSYITYPLPPYFSNPSKRLTKMPKIYFYDTGLLCYLLNIENQEQLENHPLRGAIFENMAVGELMKKRFNEAKDPNLYFYREQSGKEVDILSVTGEGINLYEIKAGKSLKPDYLEIMRYLRRTLTNVDNTSVIYNGESMGSVINIRDI